MATIKSIEEKAKLYDEAIERAKEMIKAMTNIGGVAKVDDIQYLFPELKESEDERIMGNIIATIHLYYGEPLEDEAKEMIAWLEKQGEQKPIEEYNITGIGSKNAKGKLGEMIKNLKPVNEVLEQKLTWSEEDEDNLNSAIYYIRREPYRECDVEPIVDWLKNKLSSLRPQSTWKPSDEQMDAVKDAIDYLGGNTKIVRKYLMSLYEQLKKLREK